MTYTIHKISHILYVFIHLLQQSTPSSTSESTQRTISFHFTKKSADSAENPVLRAATNRNPVYRAPRKSKDRALYSHIFITPLPGGCVCIACRHCEEYNKQKVKTFNPTKGWAHIVNQCKGIGVDVKRQLIQGTQATKRRGEVFALSKSPTTTVADMRSNALASTKKRSNS